MLGKYILCGEGYWCNSEDPSQGGVGMPFEIKEESREKDIDLAEAYLENLRVRKATKLLRENASRDIDFKINLLKRLNYKKINIPGGKVSLDEGGRNYPMNLDRMYNSVIEGLRKIVKNPRGESNLISRLDALQ